MQDKLERVLLAFYSLFRHHLEQVERQGLQGARWAGMPCGISYTDPDIVAQSSCNTYTPCCPCHAVLAMMPRFSHPTKDYSWHNFSTTGLLIYRSARQEGRDSAIRVTW